MKKSLTPRESERKAKNKKLYKIAAILFAFAAVLFIIVIAATSGNNEEDNPTTPVVTANKEAGGEMYSIHDEARDEVANGMTDSQRDEAVNWIADNYGAYFQDDKTMRTAARYGSMLYGAYLDDQSMNTYSQLGYNVFQAVRDVYREYESPESDYTLENLKQIKDDLEELGYSVG